VQEAKNMSMPASAAPTYPVFSDTASSAVGVKGWLSVIIPVYNESRCVATLLEMVKRVPVPKEIIVVDDGSTDGTRETLLGLMHDPQVHVIFHDRNRGKGAAIRTGIRHAVGEYIIIQDSDLEYDPADYPALLEPLKSGGANVVYGVRPDRPQRGMSFFLGAKFLTWFTNFLYGCHIRDEATGYKVFRASLLKRIPLHGNRFEFCPEVTAKVCRMGERIQEVPISYDPRPKGAGKKIKWTDGLDAIWTLMRYRFFQP
jgi:glycosyltransferase involved in cell wall biosynthesis